MATQNLKGSATSWQQIGGSGGFGILIESLGVHREGTFFISTTGTPTEYGHVLETPRALTLIPGEELYVKGNCTFIYTFET